jgi:hemerythrin superfamily protein
MPHDDLLQHESLIQPADAIEMLKADHRRVHKLFHSYEATDEPKMKQRIAMALFVALELHTQLEETVFYPAFTEATTRAGHALVDTSLEDHEQIEVCIEELRGLEADSAAFAAQFHALRLTVEQHIQHEERQMFPQAEVALAAQLEDLRDEMQDLKDHLLG